MAQSPSSGLLATRHVFSGETIRAHLERVVESDIFRNADRLKRFLRHIVVESLEGRADTLKEYALGTEVFDRKASFDPRIDPIVRVEAGRLRNRLKQYYEATGTPDGLRIDLPKGGYIPIYSETDGAPSAKPSVSTTAMEAPATHILVLPFADHSPNKDQQYFCDGMTEELINALTRVSALRVVAQSSALRLRDEVPDIRELGEQLSVGTIVQGSVRKAGQRVRITVQLIAVETRCYLWSETYDRQLKDVFAIQEEISRDVVQALRVRLHQEQRDQLSKRYTENLNAYTLYLRGRQQWNLRSEAGLRTAIEFFQQAIAADPSYALAYAGLADSYSLLGNYGLALPTVVRASARETAGKAVEIDSTLAEAHTSLGHVRATYDWDWEGAEREYELAISLNAGYATAHHWYAMTVLSPVGRLDECLVEIRRALELGPISPSINRDLAIILTHRREYDKALEQCRRTLSLDPNFGSAYWALGLAYEAACMLPEALAAFQTGADISGGVPRLKGALGRCHALAGNTSKALEILAALQSLADERYVSPFETALIYMGLGDFDKAFEALEKVYAVRSYELVPLRVDPRFDCLRADRRFSSLLQRMGLERPAKLT
jgi:TolB-like protein/Tfp pilus assembly protein PilF